MEEKKIKIFATYKNKNKIIKSDIIEPIQTGRAISEEIFEEMIGDDTGENISKENLKYNELSAQYWAWKNYETIGNPDYIGFMHYRRHFIFNQNYKPEVLNKRFQYGYSAYLVESIDDNYLNSIQLENKYIQETLKDTDIIVIKKANSKYLKCKNGREDFQKNCFDSHVEDYDKCMQLIQELHPEYTEEIQELVKEPYRYFYNMFIMKKEDFFEYSEFLFSILNEIDKRIDTTHYSPNALRLLGYMGEFILSLYVFKLYKTKTKRIKELYSTFVLDTSDNSLEITPAFKENNHAISMSSSNQYVPYLSTCLESLKVNCNKTQNYDIIIFERNITEQNKNILKQQIEDTNISLRFINPTPLLKNYNLKFHANYNLECYFRLVAPVILKNYDKVLFTDVDLLFVNDPAVIFNEDITNYPLAACQDFMMGSFINNRKDKSNWKEYLQKDLGLNDVYKYFNTGVMLFNIDYFNKNNYTKKILELVSKKHYRILEQDGLNAFFKDNIKYIDTAWNYPVENAIYKNITKLMPNSFYEQYQKDKKHPNIIHWAGGIKPWTNPDEEYAYIWWDYARKTPFYEESLKRMCNPNLSETLKNIFQYKKNILRYWKYKLLRNFVFGSTKERYITKKQIYKNKIMHAKALVKG